MAVVEPELETAVEPTDSDKPAKIKQPHGGSLYAHGVKGNKGGTGVPKDSVRQLAREKLKKTVVQLDKIVNGESFLVDAVGNPIPVEYRNVTSAAKVLVDLGLGPDAIPEAMISAVLRVLVSLNVLLNRTE